jgi:hypothetical protein
VLLRNGKDPFHVADPPEEMHDYDGLCFRGDRLLDLSGSMFMSLSPMSAKTGRAPTRAMELAVEKNV